VPEADAAEHRLVTVIFADLADSTHLTEMLGAEKFREMLRDYRERAAQCFQRYDGTIASYFGDGILVYFGYPHAHEDDAWRAVSASLEVQTSLDEVNRLYSQEHKVDLRVRIAVHTGTVVAGDISSESASENMAIVGNAPNIAARIQAHAQSGTVAISDATHRLVEHAFACTDLGAFALKGLSRKVNIFRVDGPAKRRSPWSAGAQASPLIGRHGPVRTLTDAWDRASSGSGGTVLISGEAGVGKTRLVVELASKLNRRAVRRIDWRCSPLHENTALGPLLQDISLTLGFNEVLSLQEKVARLERSFAMFDSRAEYVTLLAPLLGIALPSERYPPLGLSAPQERSRLLMLMAEGLLTIAKGRPVLMVVEDVHWADPSTLELLSQAAALLHNAQALIVLTSRNRSVAPWVDRDATAIELTRLDEADSQKLIRFITQEHGLAEGVVQALVAKTDGVPLFIEEMTRGVMEAERTGPDGSETGLLAVPSTLQESLAGRIDRAAVDRRVLQLSATMGREFAFDVLAAVCAAVCAMDAATLTRELDKLIGAGLLHRADTAGAARYAFRHALVQDAIYHFQLSGQRQANHQHIAETFAGNFPEIADRSPELVANHYLLSRDHAASLPFLRRAADVAIRRSANVEASNYLQQALKIIALLPGEPKRDRVELGLLTSLGVVSSARLGFAAAEAGVAFAQAHELCKRLGRGVALFPVLHGLYRFYFVRAELATAGGLSREMLGVARQEVDTALLLEGHRAAGNCRFLGGQFRKANWHFGRTIALYRTEQHHVHRFEYGADPFIVAASMGGLGQYLRGETEQGLDLMEQAVGAAEELDHPYTVCWALSLGCVLYQINDDIPRVDEYSQRQLGLAQRHGFVLWENAAQIMLGWCAAVRHGGGTGPLQAAIDVWVKTGAEAYLPYHLSLLADAHVRCGTPAAAQAVLDDALQKADRHGELWWKSELLRLRGHCALSHNDRGGAEQWFRRACAVAAAQRATLLMQRAQDDLDRLAASGSAGSERGSTGVTPFCWTTIPCAATADWSSGADRPYGR